MGGVIDEDGTQWERCNGCGGWVNINDLRYEKPSDQFQYGRDLCPKCAPQLPVAGPAMIIHLPKEL